ncbi:MAG: T9SS type A sorting domain-containing protein, partial [Hymenobacteraceae bacterium]|nr:T9SS type A sorting domain-containing protein [Hymenobacteraceae bacterium]
TWATAPEQNADRFEVQRSSNGRDYKTIGSVAATGTTSTGHDYAFEDAQPLAGVSYYRLRQVDTDGTAQLSQDATVTLSGAAIVAALSTYPQPFAADLNLTVAAPTAGAATVDVIDLTGRRVLSHVLPVVAGTTTLALPGASSLAPGAYVVRVTLPGGAALRQRIVKE